MQTHVIIMAATNAPEVLDPALLRPGRFDRQVVVDRPDVEGRTAILRVQAKKVKLDPTADLHLIASSTPGMVGADLANLVNKAALLAALAWADNISDLLCAARARLAATTCRFGHTIGLLCGYGALLVVGRGSIPHGIENGVDWPTVLSAALSLAAPGAFMVLFRISHPPAGATTLIVSLGLLSKPEHLLIVEAAVLLLVSKHTFSTG